MTDVSLFSMNDDNLRVELTYYPDKSIMPAKDLGEAIVGMSTCLKIAGRIVLLDFEDVYIYAVEEGSVKTFFVYVRRNQDKLIADVGVSVIGGVILSTFALIGTYGLASLKHPSGEMLTGVDKNVITLCTNGDFRKSVVKIARPISKMNQKVTIKFGEEGYEINCDNQYEFIQEEDERILPELRNGETVSLVGRLTRMNMVPKNDLGFEYGGRILSVTPQDKEKNVATEYHEYTPLPQVVVTGIVVRESDFVVPQLKVIRIDELKDTQINLFEGDDNTSDSVTIEKEE